MGGLRPVTDPDAAVFLLTMASGVAHSRDRIRLAVLVAVGLLLINACGKAPSASLPTPTAQPSPAIKPTMRALPALAYDPASRKLMLVGGLPIDQADYWLWDPALGWQQGPAAAFPHGFWGSTMAYDTSREKMVLIVPPGAGTWVWDEVQWRRVPSTSTPGTECFTGICDASMPRLIDVPEVAYDSKAGAVVAIALSSAVAGPHPDSLLPLETPGQYWGVSLWTWDGAVWHESRTSLFRRTRPAVAYDQARGELVVFGGPDPQVSNLAPDPTTWLWNGATWTGVTTDVHPPPGQSAAAYDPVHGEIVLVVAGETWAWNGNTWSKRSTTGPGNRLDHRMTFDDAIGQVVLFGGRTPGVAHGDSDLNDLWAWDGSAWHLLA